MIMGLAIRRYVATIKLKSTYCLICLKCSTFQLNALLLGTLVTTSKFQQT